MRICFFGYLALLLLAARGVKAACRMCYLEACKKEFAMLDTPNFESECSYANNVGLLSMVSKSPSCTEFLMERLCTFFHYQGSFVLETGCTQPGRPLCPDGMRFAHFTEAKKRAFVAHSVCTHCGLVLQRRSFGTWLALAFSL